MLQPYWGIQMNQSQLYLHKMDAEVRFLLVSRLIPISILYGHKNGKVLCPFHDDIKPSAKIHEDDDKIERLYCFSCRKQFTSWHYLKLILGIEDLIQYLRSNFDLETLEEYAKIITLARDSVIDIKRRAIPNFKKTEDINEFIQQIYLNEKEEDNGSSLIKKNPT